MRAHLSAMPRAELLFSVAPSGAGAECPSFTVVVRAVGLVHLAPSATR